MITLRSTPVEVYPIRGIPVYVKREDLAWPYPPLSKARGVWGAIEARPKVGLAVVDTARSLNGLLVATIGLQAGRKVLCGYPVYKHGDGALPGPTMAIKSLGVELVPLAANRQFVMRARMMEALAARADGPWYLFPTGLRLPETVAAVEAEARGVLLLHPNRPGTIIVPSGTGTHLAGLIRAFAANPVTFVATMGYAREEKRFRRDVERAAGVKLAPERLRVVSTISDYYDVDLEKLPPWPAHFHYECRAFNWLRLPGVVESLEQPILFWNIGA